jgi:hypothetical protein
MRLRGPLYPIPLDFKPSHQGYFRPLSVICRTSRKLPRRPGEDDRNRSKT